MSKRIEIAIWVEIPDGGLPDDGSSIGGCDVTSCPDGITVDFEEMEFNRHEIQDYLYGLLGE